MVHEVPRRGKARDKQQRYKLKKRKNKTRLNKKKFRRTILYILREIREDIGPVKAGQDSTSNRKKINQRVKKKHTKSPCKKKA